MQDPREWIIVGRSSSTPDRSADWARLRDRFAAAGIPTDKPGFLDHPNFVAREVQNRYILEDYARFTRWGCFDNAYLERAEKVIRAVAGRR